MGGWAVTIEGRDDCAGILLIVDDHAEAESIAREIRRRGAVRAVARPVRERPAVELPGFTMRSRGGSRPGV
jgi:hypothetical protein